MDITLDNMAEFMPRMGYLFTDGMFDLSKVWAKLYSFSSYVCIAQVASGEQRFIMRSTGSSSSEEIIKSEEAQMYKEYKFSLSCGEDGWDRVELTADMMEAGPIF